MKDNKKGFTLIELLAVIVILAVIALIATPIVLSIITKARISAAQDSLYGVIQASRTAYMETLLDDQPLLLPATVNCQKTNDANNGCTIKGSETDAVAKKISFSGTVPDSGTFTIDKDGKVENATETANIKVNSYSCTITNEKVKCTN